MPPPNYRLIYAVKCVGLVGALGVAWIVHLFLSPSKHIWAVTGVVLGGFLPSLAIVVTRTTPPTSLVWLTFVTDVLGVTAGIHYSGGAQNVSGPMVYIIYTSLAGLMLSERGSIAIAGLCGASYAVVVGAEYMGWIASHPLPADYSPIARIVMINGLALLGAWVGAYTMRQMRLIYQRAEDIRSEAVSVLSHDLKNPLNVVTGAAELLRTLVAPEHRHYVELIDRAAQDATDVVRNVLDVATLDDSGFRMKREMVQLDELTRRALELHELAAQAKSIEVRQTLGEPVPPVLGDPQLLTRAVGNLVSNAIKYTPNNGAIHVEVRHSDGNIIVAVHDNGPGVAPEQQDRLFQKFSRIHNDRRVEGTGLGLYIVRRVAEVHGGRAAVRSEAGEGSTFHIELPPAA